MPELRLLYLIDSIDASGGAEQSLATLAPEYRRLGIKLDVAYLNERPGLHARLLDSGAELFCLEGTGGRVGEVRRASSLIANRRPDLVHTTLFEADVVGRIAALRRRTPVVSSLVNTSYGPEHRDDPGVRTWKLRGAQVLDAVTARSARRLHAVSSHVADVMASRLRVPRARIDVIPRGRSDELLGRRTEDRRARARQALGVDERQLLLVAVGRHEHQKALDVLLRALPAVAEQRPDVLLVIAGREGNATPTLHELISARGLQAHVTLLGTRSDVADLLCAADVFILPSRREGFPGAVVEAMALETPIVASDIAEIREVVDASCAVLTRPEDPSALSEAVLNVARREHDTEQRVQRARERFVSKFSAPSVAERMRDFYERALLR